MKLLFIQSQGVNHQIERLIGVEFPGKFEEITFTDSFDHALSLLQEKNKVLVFSSWTFHDRDSKHYGEVPETIPDSKKNGDVLARTMKEKNPEVRFHVYSFDAPQTSHVDGFIQKGSRFEDDVKKIFKVIKEF